MPYIIITAIVLLICFIGFMTGKSGGKQTDAIILKWSSVAIAILFFAIFTVIKSFHSVSAGHVGVVYQFGNITSQTGPGLVTTAPWQNLRAANVQIQKASFTNLNAFSKETQDVFISATINYQVDPNDIQTLYRTVGSDYFDKLVPTRLNQFFKDETVKYTAVDIAPNRDQIRADVLLRLKTALSPYSIQVDDLLIDNISFSQAFTQSIEDKQIATQQAQAAQNRVKTAEYQAQQVAATAQGDANAVLIKAKAQSAANRLLNSSLTQQLIQYTAIKTLSPGVTTILLPSNSNFLLPSSIFGTK